MPTEEYRAACDAVREEYQAAWAAWQEVFHLHAYKTVGGYRFRTPALAMEADPEVFATYVAASKKVESLFKADLKCPIAQALCAREGVDIGEVTLIEEWQGGSIIGRQGRWFLLAWIDDGEEELPYDYRLLAP